MIALGYPRQRRACLALPTGGHDHDFMPRKTIDRVHVDRLGHILQITICLSSLDNPVQRPPRKTQCPPAFTRHFTHRLQTRGVRRKSCQQYPALSGLDRFQKIGLHTAFAATIASIEGIGGVAHQGQYAIIANRG